MASPLHTSVAMMKTLAIVLAMQLCVSTGCLTGDELDDADILTPVLNRDYRSVEGYRMREKIQTVRERLQRTRLA